jgi:hypothetical protein
MGGGSGRGEGRGRGSRGMGIGVGVYIKKSSILLYSILITVWMGTCKGDALQCALTMCIKFVYMCQISGTCIKFVYMCAMHHHVLEA